MMLELKIRKVGNSLGVVLPKEAAAKLNVAEGDSVYITESAEGGFRFTAENPEFAAQMKSAEGIIKRYRNTLRELAK
jgi:putative addiction module antidote